jgi:hypothetical protein
MHLSRMKRSRWLQLLSGMGLLALAAGGCDNSSGQFGGGLIRESQAGKEQWTIRCTRLVTPDHREWGRVLADLLGKVPGLKASNVRLTSDASGSTIYYGQYVKVASPTGALVFPEQYQKDIELIRSLAYRQQTPFFYAAPELMQASEPSAATGTVGEASTATGTHSLLIAVFYNTSSFTERKVAAEQYVQDLRSRGYPAYYYHEPLRSMVFVGDFTSADLTLDRDRRQVYGPRVEQFIARNPEEFRYQTENGHFMKRPMPDGTMAAPPSVLVPLPGKLVPAEAAPAPRPLPPMD